MSKVAAPSSDPGGVVVEVQVVSGEAVAVVYNHRVPGKWMLVGAHLDDHSIGNCDDRRHLLGHEVVALVRSAAGTGRPEGICEFGWAPVGKQDPDFIRFLGDRHPRRQQRRCDDRTHQDASRKDCLIGMPPYSRYLLRNLSALPLNSPGEAAWAGGTLPMPREVAPAQCIDPPGAQPSSPNLASPPRRGPPGDIHIVVRHRQTRGTRLLGLLCPPSDSGHR